MANAPSCIYYLIEISLAGTGGYSSLTVKLAKPSGQIAPIYTFVVNIWIFQPRRSLSFIAIEEQWRIVPNVL